jgi:hypothetical protein
MLLWGRAMIRAYDACASRHDAAVEALPVER